MVTVPSTGSVYSGVIVRTRAGVGSLKTRNTRVCEVTESLTIDNSFSTLLEVD